MLTLQNLKTLLQKICISSFDMKGSPYHDFEPTDKYPNKQDKKIGYLGGGQLGQLSALAAQKQGFDTVVFTAEGENCPSAQVSDFFEIVYSDTKDAVAAILESGVNVVTAEWENVPADLAKAISEKGIAMYPNWKVYELVQDRQTEKEAIIDCFEGNRESVVNFKGSITSESDVIGAFINIGPGILKTASGGYDGKGQQKLESETDVSNYIQGVRAEQEAYKALQETTSDEATLKEFKKNRKFVDFDEAKCIYEEKLEDFSEISVMVARSSNGDVVAFDPAYNKHENGILTESIMPAWEAKDPRISPEVIEKAKQMAMQLTERYACEEGIIGLVGVEMFVLPDGSIKINEIAPRPHNSGHPTEYSHDYSQYELLNLAITGQPLPDPKLVKKVHLRNMLHDEVLNIEGVDEKTGSEGRLEDKSYGRYIEEYEDYTVITIDYGKGKGKTDKDECALDQNGNVIVRKRGHMNVVSELDDGLLGTFKKTAE